MIHVEHLTVQYRKEARNIPAVRDVSFDMIDGTAVGIVGESGCGKTSLARAFMGLIPPREGAVTDGSIMIDNTNILTVTKQHLQKLRGKTISMIFQDPFNSLNPVLTIKEQIRECFTFIEHKDAQNRSILDQRIIQLLRSVHIPEPERICDSYPHQLSGGLRQRVMIGIAIAREPKLLIADEPTTALDVTIQKNILELLTELKKKMNMSVLLITHNLAVVSRNTSKTIVMYAGRIMEEAPTRMLFKHPKHPYTQILCSALPRLGSKQILKTVPGGPPDPWNLPSGCVFHPRCPFVHDQCYVKEPELIPFEGRKIRCNLYE
ncbi:MAG: ATP-binding cassette domain-containing protein [Elusimicrobia bacterium]|nr:ATP-binding cassette domain-containing protein [Elusimicrobiota bacterium]MBD3412504.1 ATP-binding cassette domain-containing protein [Elusimicrobiota bacterium]